MKTWAAVLIILLAAGCQGRKQAAGAAGSARPEPKTFYGQSIDSAKKAAQSVEQRDQHMLDDSMNDDDDEITHKSK